MKRNTADHSARRRRQSRRDGGQALVPRIEDRQSGDRSAQRHRGVGPFARRERPQKVPSPCLVLLDLNMPRMGGVEFLDKLRRDEALRRTLVFVMTTSGAEEDRARAYDMNIAGYVLKHRPGQSFLEAIGMLEHYWRVIEFPG